MHTEAYADSNMAVPEPSYVVTPRYTASYDTVKKVCYTNVVNDILFRFPVLSHQWSRNGVRYVPDVGDTFKLPPADERLALQYTRSGTVNCRDLVFSWRSMLKTNPGSCQAYNSGVGAFTPLELPLLPLDEAQKKAKWLASCYEKLSYMDFDWAIAIAERRKLISLTADFGRGIYRTFRLLRRGRLWRARVLMKVYFRRVKNGTLRGNLLEILEKTMKKPADLWLTWRYGWRLVLADLRSIAASLEAAHDPKAYRFSVMGGVRRELGLRPETVTMRNQSAQFIRNRNHVCTVKADVLRGVYGHVKLYYELTDPKAYALAQMVPDLTQTLWNITPGTFILDWFINFSDWLGSPVNKGIRFKYGYQTTVSECRLVRLPSQLLFTDSTLGETRLEGSAMPARKYLFKRTPFAKEPAIPLVWHQYGLLDTQKLWDVVALWRANPTLSKRLSNGV